MTDPDITWVCCPHGIVDGQLRLSVVPVPRLAASGTLSDYPTLLDWPAGLVGARFLVSFDAGPADLVATRGGDPLDSRLWQGVFPGTTPVRAFGTGRVPVGGPVLTYPSAEVSGAVRRRYVAAAAVVEDVHAQPGALLRPDFDLRPLQTFDEGVVTGLRLAQESIREHEGQDPGFAEVTSTHGSGDTPVGHAYAMQHPFEPSTQAAGDEVDFHGAVSLLADHPALMRLLGLVIDLTVPASSVPDSLRNVQVSAASTLPGGAVHHLPATAVVLDAATGTFAPAADDQTLTRGVWPVDRPEYHLESLDVDTAVRKAVMLASAPDPVTPQRSTPPTLRNDGIALVHSGRAQALVTKVARARGRRTTVATAAGQDVSEPPDMRAEDLVRGFRVDVRDDLTETYHSLHERRVSYTVDGVGPVPANGDRLADEGYAQESLTGDDALYVHERLVTWRGWSLAAPRPRAPIGRPAEVPETLQALHTHVSSRVAPGSLPRLRFGHRYRMRLRTVDLAGNSLDVDQAPDVATANLMYLRYDPVGPPVLAPTGDGTEPMFDAGETLTRLVVRDPGITPEGATEIPLDDPFCERLVLPPKGQLSLVEQHGMFDDALGNPDRTGREAVRALVPRADTDLVYPVGEFTPYLPDPQAAGIVFEGLPGTAPGEVFAVEFERGATWADVRPVRLRLTGVGRDVPLPPPRHDRDSGILEVSVQAGRSCRVRVSSSLADPSLMALLEDIRVAHDPDEPSEILDRVRTGQHPMFTPYVEIELVHAVAMPTTTDFSADVVTVRDVGQPAVGFRTTFAVDAEDTDAVALHARWTELVDDPSAGPPRTTVRTEQVLSARVPRGGLGPVAGDQRGRRLMTLDTEAQSLPRQQLPDTGFRLISYTPVATSSFTDCYVPGNTSSTSGAPRESRVLNVGVPPPPVVDSVVPSQLLPPTMFDSTDDPNVLHLVGSGDPDELPAESGWHKTIKERQGGGIRVYLRRPWFVTGAEESLGVVVVSPGISGGVPDDTPDNTWIHDAADPLTQWYSQVGQDPIRRSAPVGALTAADFLNSSYQVSITAIPDALAGDTALADQVPATVIGYVPQFDESTGLWYADVQVDARVSYMPFLRLAVCRLQRNSLNEGTTLSRISTIDLVQPLPDRTLTLLRHQQDPEVTVTLWGRTYIETNADRRPVVTVRLFAADAAADPDTARWRPVDGVPALDLTRDPVKRLWTGKMQVPTPAAGQRQRLLVVENEQLPSNGGRSAERVVHIGTLDL